PPAPDPEHLVAELGRAVHDALDHGIEAGDVYAAGEDSDAALHARNASWAARAAVWPRVELAERRRQEAPRGARPPFVRVRVPHGRPGGVSRSAWPRRAWHRRRA